MPTEKYKSVEDFIISLDDNKKAQVELLRGIISSSSDLALTEHIKWNAPSYVLGGEDRITFNLMNKENLVKLVIHMGATRKEDKKGRPILADDGDIVQWSSDIRGVISFSSLEDIRAKRETLKRVLSEWLLIKGE